MTEKYESREMWKGKVFRLLWLSGAVSYAVLMIRWHDRFQAPALHIQGQVGMPLWHGSMLLILGMAMLGAWWVIRHESRLWEGIKAQKVQVLTLFALMLAANAFLMVNAVEAIHYLQYGLLTVMLVPAFRAVLPAVFASILFGIADEWYQMMVLHVGWQGYLDFNDLVLNALGATAGGLLARCWWTYNEPAAWWWMWSGLAIVVILLFQTSLVGVSPDGGRWAIVRWGGGNPNVISGRWIDTGWGNHWFMLVWREGLPLVWLIPWVLFLRTSKAIQVRNDGESF